MPRGAPLRLRCFPRYDGCFCRALSWYLYAIEVGAKMKQKRTLKYYPKDNVLYVRLQARGEAKSVEIEPGVTAELNKGGELIGIEILDASVYLRKLIQDRLEPRLRHRLAS